MTRTFSVIGLGKLGASMAAAIAKRGFNVIGVDINPRTVDLVNAGHAPVQETDLEETISLYRERIRATQSHRDAVLNSDLSFVIVPTPSDDRGAFSLQFAIYAFREIGKVLKEKPGYHLVVLTSTVLPGSMRYGLLPVLEAESGKRCGLDFGLCYSPEFIALGSILRDFLNPDFTLVGEYDEDSGRILENAYGDIMENHPPCRRMSLENAELTKVALNTFVTTKITYANMLADLCERIPGGDVDVVTGALGLDSRIGAKYLKGAIGYGGPCFPRDNVALTFIAKALGSRAGIAETTDRLNNELLDRIVTRLRELIGDGTTFAILGLAYKPYSHVIEESQGIKLAKTLCKAGARVIGFDPLAVGPASVELAYTAIIFDSLKECLAQADVVIITTPDPIFMEITLDDFKHGNEPVTVVDFWRILASKLSDHPRIRYIPVGCSQDDQGNEDRLRKLWESP